MDANHVVLDISSDEDVGFKWACTDGCGTDIDWSELLVNLDSGAGIVNNQNCDKGYDSDDVVVVGEVLAEPKRAKMSSGLAKLDAQDREEDEDCVVLDGDPDKPAEEDQDSDGGSDDLVIVAEKGQVACRDYPHPRHLCVKFPFDSTLHSDHCNLCHCFVCDSPAPCGNWGNGNLLIDHCHATEKEELWKSERKRTKEGKIASVVSSTDSSFRKDLPEQITAPAPPLAQNSGSHGYIPAQAPSYDPPNIIRSQRTSVLSGRNGYRSNLPSQQPINPCINNTRRTTGTSLTHHSVASFPVFKRPGPLGRAPVAGRAGNEAFNDFRNACLNHLVEQVDMRQINMTYLNGAVNSHAYQNSPVVNANQVSTVSMPSQGQVQFSQPTDSSLYVHPNGNQTENLVAPISPNTNCITSQSSQSFAGVSNLQEPLPVTEERSWCGVNPDFQNLELDTQFLNTMPILDAEDGLLVFNMDYLWSPC